MTLIEGIGDEVVLVVGALTVLVMLTMAWLSTHVRERPRVDVVVLDQNRIMQLINRVRSATANTLEQTPIGYIVRPNGQNQQQRQSTNTSSDSSEPPAIDEQTSDLQDANNEQRNTNEQVSVVYAHLVPDHSTNCPLRQDNQGSQEGQNAAVDSGEVSDPPNREESSTETQQSPKSSLEVQEPQDDENAASTNSDINADSTPTHDPNTAEGLRNRRLAFFVKGRSTVEESQAAATSQSSTHSADWHEPATPPENESAMPSLPPQVSSPQAETNRETPSSESTMPESGIQDGHIRIRLKYLDDRQRLVQARPGHTISQFKRQVDSVHVLSNLNVLISILSF